jgi:hypothetical protein
MSASARIAVASKHRNSLLAFDRSELEPEQRGYRLNVLSSERSVVPLRSLRHATRILVVVWAVDGSHPDGVPKALQNSNVGLGNGDYAIASSFLVAEAAFAIEEAGGPREVFALWMEVHGGTLAAGTDISVENREPALRPALRNF